MACVTAASLKLMTRGGRIVLFKMMHGCRIYLRRQFNRVLLLYGTKSTYLCSAGRVDDRSCELDVGCQAQEESDDVGRKECIENITASQPSSAP